MGEQALGQAKEVIQPLSKSPRGPLCLPVGEALHAHTGSLAKWVVKGRGTHLGEWGANGGLRPCVTVPPETDCREVGDSPRPGVHWVSPSGLPRVPAHLLGGDELF